MNNVYDVQLELNCLDHCLTIDAALPRQKIAGPEFWKGKEKGGGGVCYNGKVNDLLEGNSSVVERS